MLLLVAAMVVPTKMWAEEIRPTKPSVGDGSIENPYQIITQMKRALQKKSGDW